MISEIYLCHGGLIRLLKGFRQLVLNDVQGKEEMVLLEKGFVACIWSGLRVTSGREKISPPPSMTLSVKFLTMWKWSKTGWM